MASSLSFSNYAEEEELPSIHAMKHMYEDKETSSTSAFASVDVSGKEQLQLHPQDVEYEYDGRINSSKDGMHYFVQDGKRVACHRVYCHFVSRGLSLKEPYPDAKFAKDSPFFYSIPNSTRTRKDGIQSTIFKRLQKNQR